MELQNLQKLIKTLSEIGLTANEANTYLTLIGIGPNPASVIAKKAAINRCTCYTILEHLMKKGFARKFIKNNVTYFSPVEPRYVLDRLKNKHNELEDKISGLSTYITRLDLLKNEFQGKPKVVFYEGEDGVKNIMEDTLTSKTLIRAYASLTELTNLLPGYFPDYYKRRAAKEISLKAIYPADELSYFHKLRDKQELRESRLIPKEFDFHLDILIYDNKVAITSLREKFGVLIESGDMFEAQKGIFDFIWMGTAEYDRIMTGMMEQRFKKEDHPAANKTTSKILVRRKAQ
jgi:sugar-specific transcriptional regulator TrmB